MALPNSKLNSASSAYVVGATAAAAILVASCTGSDATPPAAIDFVIEGATPTPPADLSEKRGGTLLFPIGECSSPDPAIYDIISDDDFTHEVHAGLTRFAPIDGWSVVPELAESWQSDSASQTFNFQLRPDLKFADGTPLTSSDVKWSWERTLKLQDDFRKASSVFESVQGHDDFVAGNTPGLSGIDTTDQLTVRVTLSEPTPHFPMLIAHSVASVVSEKSKSSWEQSRTSATLAPPTWAEAAQRPWPTGAGPFTPDTFDARTGGCTLVRNSNYWGQKAYLDAVDLVPFNSQPRDETGSWIESGKEDAAFRNNEIDYQDLNARVLRVPKSITQGLPVAPTTVEYLVFNLDLPPFDNLHFRRALMQVTPVTKLDGESDHWILPPWLRPLGSSDDLPDLNMSAKELLELCECAELYDDETFAVTIYTFGANDFYTPTADDFNPELNAVFKQWRIATGVNATFQILTPDVDFDELQDGPADSGQRALILDEGSSQPSNPPVETHQVDPEIPDPSSTIDSILSQPRIVEDYPELNELARRARAEADPQRRTDIYLQVEREILMNAIAFPIATGIPPRHRLKPWVHGFVNQPYGGSIFRSIWLDNVPNR